MSNAVMSIPMKREFPPKTKLKPAKPTKLHKAIQEKLRALIDQPLTPTSLFDIVQFAGLAQQMLQKIVPLAHFDANYASSIMGSNPFGIVPIQPALAPSPPSETYGATLVKELMALMPGLQSKPQPINQILSDIDALKKAKKHKLAKKLEKTLDDAVNALPKAL